jgi:hypothetical protein
MLDTLDRVLLSLLSMFSYISKISSLYDFIKKCLHTLCEGVNFPLSGDDCYVLFVKVIFVLPAVKGVMSMRMS